MEGHPPYPLPGTLLAMDKKACAVCSVPAPFSCSRCKAISYCTPAHQKEDWPAHKVQCPRLAQEALAAVFHPCDEELLLRTTTCLAQNGYHKEVGVMVQLNKAFWSDEQIWDAYKDVPGPRGRTRLMYASFHNFIDKVKWLLARGARPNGSDKDGLTAQMGASQKGFLGVVRELTLRGANVNAATTDDGSTALMIVCEKGHMEVVCELLNSGANVNAAKSFSGITSLIIASQRGYLEVARELIARGADVNAARLSDGCTALIMASQKGYLELVRELIDKGASVNAAGTVPGYTALIIASAEGHLKVARLLLQKGADKFATSSDGETAFSLASGPHSGPHKAALQALLKP